MPIGLTDSGTCRSVQVGRGQVTTRSRRGQARSRQVGNSARFRGHDGARSAEPVKRRGRYRELAWPLNAHVPEAGVGQGPGIHCISMLPLNAHVPVHLPVRPGLCRTSPCGSPGRQATRFPRALGGKQHPAPRKSASGLAEEPDSPVVKEPSSSSLVDPLDAGEPGQLSARPARGLTEAEWALGQGPQVGLPRTMRPSRILVPQRGGGRVAGP